LERRQKRSQPLPAHRRYQARVIHGHHDRSASYPTDTTVRSEGIVRRSGDHLGSAATILLDITLQPVGNETNQSTDLHLPTIAAPAILLRPSQLPFRHSITLLRRWRG
jgi:hypothetical protein